jgi:hypothetical protein
MVTAAVPTQQVKIGQTRLLINISHIHPPKPKKSVLGG